ncbi:hypothetical protein ACW7N6_38740 [Streptomyces sp. UC1A3]
MSGLPLIQPENATGEAAALLEEVQQALGLTPNLAKAMANSPAALKGFLDLRRALRGEASPYPSRRASRCWSHSTPAATTACPGTPTPAPGWPASAGTRPTAPAGERPRTRSPRRHCPSPVP